MVESFRYLGQISSHNASISLEILQIIIKAILVFSTPLLRNDLRRRVVWSDKLISRSTQIRIYKTRVLSVLLYCAETWPVSQEQIHKLESIEMSCLRRICRHSLSHRKTNLIIRGRQQQLPYHLYLDTMFRLVGKCVSHDAKQISLLQYSFQVLIVVVTEVGLQTHGNH